MCGCAALDEEDLAVADGEVEGGHALGAVDQLVEVVLGDLEHVHRERAGLDLDAAELLGHGQGLVPGGLALRSERIDRGLPLSAGFSGEAMIVLDAVRAEGQAPWYETLAMAKELGGVEIQACSLSMDVLKITEDDLDDLVDGTEGVTAFYLAVGDGQILFI